MDITVAKHGGFCFGVSRAVRTVEENIAPGVKLFTFGQIIHNPQVVERFESRGVGVIQSVDEAEEGSTVIIRSHGVSPAVIEALEQRGARVINATCPHVTHIQQTVRKHAELGERIFIVGDNGHPEVIGINGWCGDTAEIIQSVAEAAAVNDDGRKCCVVAQTGTPAEKWETVTAELKKRLNDAEFVNTICSATALRQKEAAKLASSVDVMIVIGGSASFNTKKLYELCRRTNERTYSVERLADLSSVVIKSNETLGITAGASTPEWLIKEVKTIMSEVEKIEGQNWLEEFEEQKKIRTGSIVTGEIVSLSDSEMFLNIGYKSDALLKAEEVVLEPGQTLTSAFQLGQSLTAEVLKLNDGEGNVLLSRKKVELSKAWDKISEAAEKDEVITVTCKEVVKGGLVASVNGIRVFIPASQVDLGFVGDLSKYVGQELEVKVLEIDRNKRRVVASRKVIVQAEAEAKKAAALASVEVNMIVRGIVKRFTSFGAFVDIGDIDGLLHITDMAWYRLTNPKSVLSVGQEIDCVILAVDKEKGKISLGYKQLQPRPWDNIFEKYPIGSTVSGTVARVVSFGAFVALEPGIDGLVHVSQIANRYVKNPAEVISAGQQVEALVVDIDPEAKRISLSIKALLPEETEEAAEAVAEEAVEEVTEEN